MLQIKYVERPELNRPVMIMGFSGWPNAGEVSTGTINYLKHRLDARLMAHIEPGPFFNFTEARPTATIADGRVRELAFPGLHFYYTKQNAGESDLILFSGLEPHYNWQGFCFLVFEVVKHMGVEAIYTLGGTYDYIPHWIPSRISATYSDEKANGLLSRVRDVQPAEYEGPISIHTVILTEGKEKGLPVAGLWGHAPVYIQTGNLKIHRAMVDILKKAAGFRLDSSDLLKGIKEMDRQIEELTENNEQLKEYIDDLKDQYQESGPSHKPDYRSSHNGKVISLTDFMKRDED